MEDHRIMSIDKAFRPCEAMRTPRIAGSGRLRHPLEQAEVDRRVAIYARQVEQTGRITWLPHRGEGQGA